MVAGAFAVGEAGYAEVVLVAGSVGASYADLETEST